MNNDGESYCRLTEEGLTAWAKNNIEADARQVFTIQYRTEDYLWIKVWWGESLLMAEHMVKEVVWDDSVGDYCLISSH